MTLTEARTAIRWTQTQLAKAVGAGVSTINELEKSASVGTINSGYSLVMRIVKVLQREGLDVVAEDIFPVESSAEAIFMTTAEDGGTSVITLRKKKDRRSGGDRREGVA